VRLPAFEARSATHVSSTVAYSGAETPERLAPGPAQETVAGAAPCILTPFNRCADWYAKSHSMIATARIPQRHTTDAIRSRRRRRELGKTLPHLPSRQGVGGSNPPCSTQLSALRIGTQRGRAPAFGGV